MLTKFIAVPNRSQHSYLMNRIIGHLLMILLLVGCASEAPIPPTPERAELPGYDVHARYNQPYKVKGKTYHPMLSAVGYRKRGIASWYGDESGDLTAMGGRFNPRQFTAAHKTLPLPCRVKVTNTENGRSLIVTVNDRGPFHKDRLIDLSHAAAKRLGLSGVAGVEVEYLDDRVDGL
jgi:rare lipoprotein A